MVWLELVFPADGGGKQFQAPILSEPSHAAEKTTPGMWPSTLRRGLRAALLGTGSEA
jgi:hypothetical protein